ncbi:MAG: pyridine nucleotide-disulfide oxidoreductase [uncultured archaeon A07HN63]|nr:MAG: pyridine nucleotide-disulfide oxidoreductase [uncultured archaeon A07HN63]
MTAHVVVIGAGYAGAGTVQSFEDEINDGEAELTWISEHDYHLVLHETHRVIRNPQTESKVAIPVDEIKSPETNFVRDRVTGVDTDDRTVELRDGEPVDYDYLLVGVGSSTAFFGIDGLEEHALTMKSLDDAREIHEAIRAAGEEATQNDPAQVVVGGAGLSGIQTAGEIAGYRDDTRTPLEITLVEGLDEIFPGNDPRIQGALKKRLLERDVEILTGDFISEVDDEEVHLGEEESMDYDVLIWTGGSPVATRSPAPISIPTTARIGSSPSRISRPTTTASSPSATPPLSIRVMTSRHRRRRRLPGRPPRSPAKISLARFVARR